MWEYEVEMAPAELIRFSRFIVSAGIFFFLSCTGQAQIKTFTNLADEYEDDVIFSRAQQLEVHPCKSSRGTCFTTAKPCLQTKHKPSVEDYNISV